MQPPQLWIGNLQYADIFGQLQGPCEFSLPSSLLSHLIGVLCLWGPGVWLHGCPRASFIWSPTYAIIALIFQCIITCSQPRPTPPRHLGCTRAILIVGWSQPAASFDALWGGGVSGITAPFYLAASASGGCRLGGMAFVWHMHSGHHLVHARSVTILRPSERGDIKCRRFINDLTVDVSFLGNYFSASFSRLLTLFSIQLLCYSLMLYLNLS